MSTLVESLPSVSRHPVSGGAGDSSPAPIRLAHLLVGFTVGGAEKLVLDLAHGAPAERFSVTVVSLKGPGPFQAAFEEAGVRTVTLGGGGRLDWRILPGLARFLRRERIQLLNGHTFRANVAARVVGRLAGVPAVISSHHGSDLWMGRRHRLIERLTAPLSTAITACSEDVRSFAAGLSGLPPARIHLIHNGIDPERFRGLPGPAAARRQLGLPPAGLLAGFVGRLVEPLKGLGILLRAAAQLSSRLPELSYVVAGDGPDRSALEEQAGRRGVAARFHFLGETSQIPTLLAALDLLVLPSLAEGFGIALAEAMAAGLPVVASRVGGVPELVRDGVTGLLFPPGDVTSLASALVRLGTDPALRQSLGAAGRHRVETHFTIEQTRKRYETLYQQLPLNKGGRPPDRP